MISVDDIKGLEPACETEKADDHADETSFPAPSAPRTVGPESEVRGGPEAPSDNA